MKTLILAACLALSATQAPASGRLDVLFAGCVGRFSAEMEHAWLMNSDLADHLADRRLTFLSLMEATMPPDAARDVLRHRIDHKIAHASLLSIATFGQDRRQAQAAEVAARSFLLQCEKLLLDS